MKPTPDGFFANGIHFLIGSFPDGLFSVHRKLIMSFDNLVIEEYSIKLLV